MNDSIAIDSGVQGEFVPPPPTPPVLSEFLGSEDYKNASHDQRLKAIDSYFNDLDQFASDDASKEELFKKKIEIKDIEFNDEVNRAIVSAVPEGLRREDNLQAVKSAVLQYHGLTDGLSKPLQLHDRNGNSIQFRLPDLRQLTEQDVGKIAYGEASTPNLLPSELQKVQYESAAGEESDDPVQRAMADAQKNFGFFQKPETPALTSRDANFEKQFKGAFDALNQRVRLKRESELSKWFSPSEAQDENGSLFSMRIKPQTKTNTWQVRYEGKNGQVIKDVDLPDGVDFFKNPEQVQAAIQDKLRDSLEDFPEHDDQWDGIGPVQASSRNRMAAIIGEKDYGFLGSTAAGVARGAVQIPYKLGALGAVGAGAAVNAVGLGSTQIDKDNPAYDWFTQSAMTLNHMAKTSAMDFPKSESARNVSGWIKDAGGGWSINVLGDKLGSVGEGVTEVLLGGLPGMASMVGGSMNEEFGRTIAEQSAAGNDDVTSARNALYSASIVGGITGAAQIASLKLMQNNALASETIRDAVKGMMSQAPGRASQISREFLSSTVAALPGQMGTNIGINTSSRVASELIHDLITPPQGGDSPIKHLFTDEQWQRILDGVKDDGIISAIFSVGHGVRDAASPVRNVFEPSNLGAVGPNAGRRVYGSGDWHVAIAPDGRFARFSNREDANYFHDQMSKRDDLLSLHTEKDQNGNTKWKDSTSQASRDEISNLHRNIEDDLNENVMRHAFLNSTERGIGMYDSLKDASNAALHYASKLVLKDDAPLDQQRRSFVDELENDYIERSVDWKSRRAELMASHGERYAEWPAAREEINQDIDGLRKQLAETQSDSPEAGELLRRIGDLVKKRDGIKHIEKTYTPEEVARRTDEQISHEKRALRNDGIFRAKAEAQADEVFSPNPEFTDFNQAGLGSPPTADLQVPTGRLAGAVNKHFVIEEKTYTGTDGQEYRGYELRFRGPLEAGSPEANYESQRHSGEQIGRAKQRAAEQQRAADAGLLALGEAAKQTVTPRDVAGTPESIVAATEEAMSAATRLPDLVKRGGKSAEKSAAVIAEKYAKQEARIQATLDKLTQAERARNQATEKSQSQWSRYARNAAKGSSITKAQAAVESTPEEAPKTTIEKVHGNRVLNRVNDADVVKQVLEETKASAKEKSSKTQQSENLKTLLGDVKELVVGAESEPTTKSLTADMTENLKGYTDAERSALAKELGLEKSDPESISKAIVRSFKESESKSSYKPSEDDGSNPAPVGDEVTIDDLIANEEAQSTDNPNTPEKAGGFNLGRAKDRIAGRRQEGSTIIFSEVADMAVKGIKAGWNAAKFVAEAVSKFGKGIAKAARDVWNRVAGVTAQHADRNAHAESSREAFLVDNRFVRSASGRLVDTFGMSPALRAETIRAAMTPEQRSRLERVERDNAQAAQRGQLAPANLEREYEIVKRHYSTGSGFLDRLGIDWWKRVAIHNEEMGALARMVSFYEIKFNQRYIVPVEPFVKASRERGIANPNGLSRDEYNQWKRLYLFGSRNQIESFLSSNPKFDSLRRGWESWTNGISRSIRDEAVANGVDLGVVQDYLPRAVKDYDGLRDLLQSENHPALAGIADEISQATHGLAPGSDEYINKVNSLLFERGQGTPRSGQHIKGRKLQFDINDPIVDRLMEHYEGPDVSLERYVNRMARHTTVQRFFGSDARSTISSGTVQLPTGAPSSLPKSSQAGGILDDLIQRGEISPKDQREVLRLFQDYFNAKPSNQIVRIAKTLSTPLVLNNPVSATRQLDGLIVTAVQNGLIHTYDGIVTPRNQRLTMDDLGITANIQLHSQDMALPWIGEKVWKWSLYKAMDAAEGNAYLNARIKAIGAMSDADAMTVLRPYQRLITKPMDVVLEDIRAGRWKGNQDVEYIAFAELSEVRPTSLASQPVGLLQGGSAAKLAYHLRLFSVNRFNYLREHAMGEWKNGNPAVALARTSALVAGLVAAGATHDEIQDYIFGRVGSMRGHVYDNLFKLGPGVFSKYTSDQIASGNIKDSVQDMLFSVPALDFGDAIGRTWAKARKNAELGKHWYADLGKSKVFKFIPSLGASQYYYSRFGGGPADRERAFEQSYSSEVQDAASKFNALKKVSQSERQKNGMEAWYQSHQAFMEIKSDADKLAKLHMKRNDITQALHISKHLSDIFSKPETWNDNRVFYGNELAAMQLKENLKGKQDK